MKTTQSLGLTASGLMAGFTISLFTLFFGYADWLIGGTQDMLLKYGWSGMVFIFLSLLFIGEDALCR